VLQVRAATKIDPDTPLDVALGLSSYKALQVKNYISGSLMLLGGFGLIFAGAAESSGLVTLGSLAPAIELFGYTALVLNVLVGLFSDESSNWLSGRLFDLDFQGYRKRAITCEAAHLLLAYLCGLPLEEYSRKHVGYPLKPRPTGRAQVYSTRKGDREVAPRKRPLGLPPWASLEQEADDEGLFGRVDAMPVKNGYTAKEIDRLTLVLLSAPVAEYLTMGKSSNGALAYQQLDTCMLMAQDAMSPSAMQSQARWGLIKVTGILEKHRNKLAALVAAMEREASLQELIATIETTRD